MQLNTYNGPVEKVEPGSAIQVTPDVQILRSLATELAQRLVWIPHVRTSETLNNRWHALSGKVSPLLHTFRGHLNQRVVSEDLRLLYENATLLSAELHSIGDGFKRVRNFPHVRTASGAVVPRMLAIAEAFTDAVGLEFTESAFTDFVDAFQETTALDMVELWMLAASIKLVLLERIASFIPGIENGHSAELKTCVLSLQELCHTSWKDAIEPLILLDRILGKDPAGAYAKMDFESRNLYRATVAGIAERSDYTECEVAATALALAHEAAQLSLTDVREANRYAHVGYYLIAEGVDLLHEKVGYHPALNQRIQKFLKRNPDDFYLFSIAALTLFTMSAMMLLLTEPNSSPLLVLFAMAALLLPCSQSAVQLTNYLTASLIKPQILPKIDLSKGIPKDCTTLVAIPALLLNEHQVRQLVDHLEVRFLGNRDRNLHFALLTDLPDSTDPPSEEDPRVNLCGALVAGLNQRYAARAGGSFFLFHRHRVYNPREHVWMGWERKRGKLLDLNSLLRRQYDSFPVKVGELSMLPQVRFVITLDADTELPRGSAHRMIGALAHPLNQAVIDPEKNIVTAGYGILQPRVAVSVQSAARSRLAKMYSGQTGLDIYTRTISDAYQDLYGEGTFAGKGIYEVDVLRQVLDGRFPQNALLSHDLIEGAYARAGLVSDIEIIEDYPSHYSAYNRRKHRWLRGDWQVAEWLAPTVPGENGEKVSNPISLLSQWKILDNLRRSLVEPATFLLLVLGWLVLPGTPRGWTLAAIAILLVPALCHFAFTLLRAIVERKMAVVREALEGLLVSAVNVLLMLMFLAHQMLLSLDAMVRALVRRMFTRRRLLQWETAAEAELGHKARTPLDAYLDWIPALSVALGVLILLVRPQAFLPALPFLVLWASSKFLSLWLNRSPHEPPGEVSDEDETLIRDTALRTWRYFAEFSTEEHNYLIPDNLQGNPPRIAPRVSPTNLGLLLNARQVACEFGYLTVPEMADLTEKTLATINHLPRHRGHLLNWYNTNTLQPLNPAFVSSVDSGNLVASLWTLQQGCLEQLQRPIMERRLAKGVADYFRILAAERLCSRKLVERLHGQVKATNWLDFFLAIPEDALDQSHAAQNKREKRMAWFPEEARLRLEQIKQTVRLYVPWLLPDFEELRNDPALAEKFDWQNVALEHLPAFIDRFSAHLDRIEAQLGESRPLVAQLRSCLPEARQRIFGLIQDLRGIATLADKLAEEMDFSFLLDRRRKLLSIGFDVASGLLQLACYDLLASEARTATFVAITKDEIPQDTWFQLGRVQTLDHGHPILVSWSGTMFEYLMPAIWMRSYPNTLLERSRWAVVRAQRAYAAARRTPWGISESSHACRDADGTYQYLALGLPHIALQKSEEREPVISPYSTFLALHVDPREALKNLRRMKRLGWVGSYGFYESADYGGQKRLWRRYELVRCWMAHHQGMSLLAMANFLCNGIVQHWFHRSPRVQATELLLQEKLVPYVAPPLEKYGTAA